MPAHRFGKYSLTNEFPREEHAAAHQPHARARRDDPATSANLVTLARGADLLVHEVFADDVDQPEREGADAWESDQRLPHLTSHTPVSEVGKEAARAGVRRLVLTHFLPGDDALPDDYWIGRVRQDFDGDVVVGHDLMEITV